MIKEVIAKVSRVLKSLTGKKQATTENSSLDVGVIAKMQGYRDLSERIFFKGYLGETRGIWNEWTFNLEDLATARAELKEARRTEEIDEASIESANSEVPIETLLQEPITTLLNEVDVTENVSRARKTLAPRWGAIKIPRNERRMIE
jgi:hypothetical protein